MATKPRLRELKRKLEKLRQDSLTLVSSANKIVYAGVQKIADRELKALNDYYRAAVKAIRDADRRGSYKGLAQKQLDLLQRTVNEVIAHARESLEVVSETRAELAALMQKHLAGGTPSRAALKKAVAPARRAIKRAKTTAGRAARKAHARTRAAASVDDSGSTQS
ncbi:phasin family protein [bacterium]|nr:phasin family protein [bacterium]